MNNELKEQYVSGYKALQTEWKKKDKELLVVGRLAYWLYWISKHAEASNDSDERKQLFDLKSKGLVLLSKSDYVQIRKYVPVHHKKLCYRHQGIMKTKKMNPHLFIYKRRNEIAECSSCQNGAEHYYSLYSVAILNEKEDIEERKPLFVMYSPYILLKDEFPDLDSLERVKKFYGTETCTIDVGKKVYELDLEIFSAPFASKYFTKNHNDLSKYLLENKDK